MDPTAAPAIVAVDIGVVDVNVATEVTVEEPVWEMVNVLNGIRFGKVYEINLQVTHIVGSEIVEILTEFELVDAELETLELVLARLLRITESTRINSHFACSVTHV